MRYLILLALVILPTQSLARSCHSWLAGENSDFWQGATVEDVKTCLKGYNAWDRANYQDTPLHYAAIYMTDPAVVALLVSHGANINAKGVGWFTPLHYAAESSTLAMAQAMLVAGANVNAVSETGQTPLLRAASSSSDPAIVIALLQAGADKTVKGMDSKTALAYARANPAMKGSEALQMLR